MKLVDVYHFPTLGRSNYFLASLRKGQDQSWPEPGTAEVSQGRMTARLRFFLATRYRDAVTAQ